MTLRASDGETEPGRAGRGDAIGHGVKTTFERIDPAFFVQHGVAMKTGGDPLRLRGVWQQITRELFDRELIEWHVGVHRVDHPITPWPDAAWPVLFVSVCVGVSRQVEPFARPAFAVMR